MTSGIFDIFFNHLWQIFSGIGPWVEQKGEVEILGGRVFLNIKPLSGLDRQGMYDNHVFLQATRSLARYVHSLAPLNSYTPLTRFTALRFTLLAPLVSHLLSHPPPNRYSRHSRGLRAHSTEEKLMATHATMKNNIEAMIKKQFNGQG